MVSRYSKWVLSVLFALVIFDDAKAREAELIPDNQFRRGFAVFEAKPGKHVRYGDIMGLDKKAKPVWNLLQWSSRFPLALEPSAVLKNGTLVYSNAAKTVTIAPGVLGLAVNSGVEYGAHARRKQQPWVHLLVEQQAFEQPAQLEELSAAKLHVEARLTRAKKLPVEGYTPDLHAAQFQIFFTLQNRNKKSPGFGDLVWFGVPIYDDRHRIPPAFKEQDWGGTAKFIFTPDGTNYTRASAQDGNWITLDADLLPLMHEALETAWARGFLKGSKEMGDYYIGGMNMGWEVTGHFDVEMEVRHLKLALTRVKD